MSNKYACAISFLHHIYKRTISVVCKETLSVEDDVPTERSLKVQVQTKGTRVHVCAFVHWGGL